MCVRALFLCIFRPISLQIYAYMYIYVYMCVCFVGMCRHTRASAWVRDICSLRMCPRVCDCMSVSNETTTCMSDSDSYMLELFHCST